ncbi:unnamed protein product, partial [Symbiodinium pilosum]
GLGYAPLNPPPPREPNPWLLRDAQPRSEATNQVPAAREVPKEADRLAQPHVAPGSPPKLNGGASSGNGAHGAHEWKACHVEERAVGASAVASEGRGDMHQPPRNESQRHQQQWPQSDFSQPSVLEQPYYRDLQQTDDAGSAAWEQESNDFSSFPGQQLPDIRTGQERQAVTSSGGGLDRDRLGRSPEEAIQATLMSAIEAAPQVEALLQSSSSIGHVRGALSVLVASDVLFST